jgi:phosphonate transport system substrate-binding protein
VLVRRDSQLNQLADLRGRSLAFHQNMRACLAQPWLDTLLLKETGKLTAECVGKLTQSPKLSQAVLPVFFHQLDACVVSRTEFETMCELNPQIGQQLKIIASSPEVVTSVLCFRADYAPSFKEQLFTALRDLHKTPAGLQVLTIFQSDKIEDQPASCLDSGLELLVEHDQICGGTKVVAVPVPPPMAGRTPP